MMDRADTDPIGPLIRHADIENVKILQITLAWNNLFKQDVISIFTGCYLSYLPCRLLKFASQFIKVHVTSS